MAWPHLEKTKHKHKQTGPDVEPPRQEKEGGGPKNTWRCDLEADFKQTGKGWQQLERIAQDAEELLWMTYAPGGVKGLSK